MWFSKKEKKKDIEKITLYDLLTEITVRQIITTLTVLGGGCWFIFTLGENWGKHNEKGTQMAIIEEQKRIIDKQKNKFSKLEPHLTLTNQFDLRKNVIHSYSRDIPKNTPFLEGGIYAATEIAGLEYKYEKNILYFSEMFDLKYCGKHIDNLAKSHTWYGTNTNMHGIDPSFEFDGILQPSISLQSINKVRLGNKILNFFECLLDIESAKLKKTPENKAQEVNSETNSSDTESINQIIEFAQDIENRDLVGIFHSLLEIINFIVTIAVPDIWWESSQVQKDAQALYATHMYSIHNIPWVNKEENLQNNLSVKAQFIIIESYQSIYFIQIISPSTNGPYNHDFQTLVGQWISTLRLVEK